MILQQNRIMNELPTQNILYSQIHSFQQFYHTARQIIQNSFTWHKESNLNNQMIDQLSEVQIGQYNFIEMETFQLSKQIKSKLTCPNQQQISIMLIKINNILEEVQKLCGSLKIIFVFQLFRKIAICLTILASLNCQNNTSENILALDIYNKKITKTKSKQIEQRQNKLEQAKQNSKIHTGQNLIPRIKQVSKQLKKLKLGGISLYNESYKRQIENRQLLIGYFDMINDNTERQKFWEEVQRDFKETIGIAQTSNLTQNESNSKKQLSQLGATLSQKFEGNKSKDKNNQIQISGVVCHSVNANNIIYNSKVFDYQLEVESISTLDLQRAIDSITEAFHNQKLFTLQSIKKLMKQISKCYQNTISDWSELLNQQKLKVEDLQRKLFARSFTFNQAGTQTINHKTVDKFNEQFEKLKLNQIQSKQFIKSLQQIITRQNNQLLNYEKSNMQNLRKIESHQNKINELENKIKDQQKNRKAKCKNKQGKHKQLYEHYQFPKSVKQIKIHFQILAQALEDLRKHETNQNKGDNINIGDTSVKNILNTKVQDNQQKNSNQSSSEKKMAKLIQFMKSENNIKEQNRKVESELYEDTEIQIQKARSRKQKKTIKPVLNTTFRSQLGQNKFEKVRLSTHQDNSQIKYEKQQQKLPEHFNFQMIQNIGNNKHTFQLQHQSKESCQVRANRLHERFDLQINSKVTEIQIKSKTQQKTQSISIFDHSIPSALKQSNAKSKSKLGSIKQQITPSQKILMDHHDILNVQSNKNKKQVVKKLIQKHLQPYEKKIIKTKQNASEEIGLSFYNTNFNDSPNKYFDSQQFSRTTFSNDKHYSKNMSVSKLKDQENIQQKTNAQTLLKDNMKLSRNNKKLKTYIKGQNNKSQNIYGLQKFPRYSNILVARKNNGDIGIEQNITEQAEQTVICDVVQYEKIKQIYDESELKRFGKLKIEKRNTHHEGFNKNNNLQTMENQIQNSRRGRKNIQKLALMKITQKQNQTKDKKYKTNFNYDSIYKLQRTKRFG